MLPVSMMLALRAAFASPAPPVHCQLREANQLVHRWEGSCYLLGQASTLRLKPAKAITSGRWRRDADPTTVWAGDIVGQDSSTDDVELELYAPSETGVLRTGDGWYGVSAYRTTPTLVAFDVDTAATLQPNELDREIVRRADALLSSTDVWNRADNRRCPASAKTWSIYCALIRGSEVAACGAHHRRPAMETVRVVIEERTVGRDYEHRLMGYNNDTTTTLADVHAIFAEALRRIPGGPDASLPPPPVCPPQQTGQLVDSLAKKHYNARLVDFNTDPDVSFADLQTFFRILRERLVKRMK